jgi:hypothetical protein
MTDLEPTSPGSAAPRLLVRAAQMAASAPCAARRAARRPVTKFLAEEAMLNAARLGGGLGYSPRRHVQVMSALMFAAAEPGPDAQMKASGISALRRSM